MTHHSPMNHFVIIVANVVYELPGTIPEVLCVLSHLISQKQPFEVGTIILILQRGN